MQRFFLISFSVFAAVGIAALVFHRAVVCYPEGGIGDVPDQRFGHVAAFDEEARHNSAPISPGRGSVTGRQAL